MGSLASRNYTHSVSLWHVLKILTGLRVGVLNRLGSKRPWTQSARFAELMARRRDDGSLNATDNPLVAAGIVADFVFDEWTMDNLTLAQQVASVRSHEPVSGCSITMSGKPTRRMFMHSSMPV